jgi:hypothetical protein
MIFCIIFCYFIIFILNFNNFTKNIFIIIMKLIFFNSLRTTSTQLIIRRKMDNGVIVRKPLSLYFSNSQKVYKTKTILNLFSTRFVTPKSPRP